MPVTKEKIVGMFVGAFIGDTLGKPVETWRPDRIKEIYGRLTTIESPAHHKWFKGEPAGTWSDDTQLTVAVAEGMIAAGGLDMDAQKEVHVKALRESTNGWGGSTRESVRRMANGKHWSQSGQGGSDVGRGTGAGNGVPMKIAPVGAWVALSANPSEVYGEAVRFAVDLSRMTHQTSVSASAALAQMTAIEACLRNTPDTFSPDRFIDAVVGASFIGSTIIPETGPDNITERFKLLGNHGQFDTDRIVAELKGGCYAYESVPFTFMFLVKNYQTVEALYDVINAGGDTDSNGSMLGANLGALHGPGVFPQHLHDALDPAQKTIVLDVADRFYQKFGAQQKD
jgi:ADP-ribosyl-[dinitrogen reductase] hydrolase